MLWENKGHSSVHDEKACLDSPDSQDLHLFHNQDELRAIDAIINLSSAEIRDIFSRFDEIATGLHNTMHDRYEHGVCGLWYASVDTQLKLLMDARTIASSMR